MVNLDLITYYQKIGILFPRTLFQWCFKIDNQLKFSIPKTFQEIGLNFFSREIMNRTALNNNNSLELRLDLDYTTFDLNLKYAKEIIKRLKEIGLNKYLIYFTGGKGVHITLRYSLELSLNDLEPQLINKKIWSYLNLNNILIDEALFKPYQMISCESFKHRHTLNKKFLISEKDFLITNECFNPNYLEDSYLNSLSKDLMNYILKPDIKPISKTIIKPINTKENIYKKNYLIILDRFFYIYSKLKDGHKRVLVTLQRFLLVNFELEEAQLIFKDFCLKHNLQLIKFETTNKAKLKNIFIFPKICNPKLLYGGLNLK